LDIVIGERPVGLIHPTFFIADIAANHDGSLDRAKTLIGLARDAGADAAKFQHFKAETIVSRVGFERLGGALSHQELWSKPVELVYKAASLPDAWTPVLRDECDRVGITFMSSPYDLAAVDLLDPYVPAFKIGSGDIDWLEEIEYIAAKQKPVILATGAATLHEVRRAVETIRRLNDRMILMQCNTNYTAADANFDHLNLNVLKTYAALWPDLVLGLSDHTQGNAAVLGAVALGARVIERHFTDDSDREGPDHRFAITPGAWADMVSQTRKLERALGSSEKFVAGNEMETAVVQRRCIRAARPLPSGHRLTRADLDVLRPAPAGSIRPSEIDAVVGRSLRSDLIAGEELRWSALE
jgi:sialic acid synthase SpsE